MPRTFDVFTCEECGWDTTIGTIPATRTDPGCYDADLECSNCGAEVGPDPDDVMTLEELKWAAEGD